jgi:hypothetical protein
MEYFDYSNADPDTLVTCPFDEVHRVRVGILVRHLIKCQKNANPKDYVFCKYTRLHVMPRAHYEYHIQRCHLRGSTELSMKKPGEPHVGGNCELPVTNEARWTPQTDEDWDDESHSEGTSAPVFRFGGTTTITTSLKNTTSSEDYPPQQTRVHPTTKQNSQGGNKARSSETGMHPQQWRDPASQHPPPPQPVRTPHTRGWENSQTRPSQPVVGYEQRSHSQNPSGVSRSGDTPPMRPKGRGMGILGMPRQPKVAPSQ